MRRAEMPAETLWARSFNLNRPGFDLCRFLLLASFSPLWVRGLPLSSFAGRKAADRSNAFVLTTGLVVASYFLETLLAGALALSALHHRNPPFYTCADD